jgi:hypothetical protein
LHAITFGTILLATSTSSGSSRSSSAKGNHRIEAGRHHAYLKGIGGSNLAAAGFNNELRELNKPQATIRLKRLQDLLERANLIMGDFTERIEALSSFVSGAGFRVWEKLFIIGPAKSNSRIAPWLP